MPHVKSIIFLYFIKKKYQNSPKKREKKKKQKGSPPQWGATTPAMGTCAVTRQREGG
jgi:hypothetical protein